MTIDSAQIPEYPNFSNTFADRPEYHKEDRLKWREQTGLTKWEEWQPVVARAYEHFAQTDSALVQILDTLERLGLAESTIVIYTADHGDILASNGGLFDKDAMMTEETMRIPLAIRWPGVAPSGAVSDALVCNMDVVPTVLDLVGADIPAYMDGESLTSLLQSPGDASRRDALMAESYGHKEYDGLQRVVYSGDLKYVAHEDDSDELYDLKNDPFEMVNRIDDPLWSAALHEMKGKLLALMEKHDDNRESSLRLIGQKSLQS
jgi:arylsulfatase A-like enzyme